jgi:hypothetical protein
MQTARHVCIYPAVLTTPDEDKENAEELMKGGKANNH